MHVRYQALSLETDVANFADLCQSFCVLQNLPFVQLAAYDPFCGPDLRVTMAKMLRICEWPLPRTTELVARGGILLD